MNATIRTTGTSLVDKIGRQVITVEETGKVLGLGRTAAYDAVRRGEIPSIRLGRRIVVPVPALERMLRGELPLNGGCDAE